MKATLKLWIIFVGLIVGGISYWLNPYNELSLMGVHIYLILCIGSLLASFFIQLLSSSNPVKIIFLLSLGTIIAIVIRIVYDTTFWDSTSHNLAPFEILITAFIIFPSAFAGVYLARLIKWLERDQNRDH